MLFVPKRIKTTGYGAVAASGDYLNRPIIRYWPAGGRVMSVSALGILESFDQEEDLGRHYVVEIRGIS